MGQDPNPVVLLGPYLSYLCSSPGPGFVSTARPPPLSPPIPLSRAEVSLYRKGGCSVPWFEYAPPSGSERCQHKGRTLQTGTISVVTPKGESTEGRGQVEGWRGWGRQHCSFKSTHYPISPSMSMLLPFGTPYPVAVTCPHWPLVIIVPLLSLSPASHSQSSAVFVVAEVEGREEEERRKRNEERRREGGSSIRLFVQEDQAAPWSPF